MAAHVLRRDTSTMAAVALVEVVGGLMMNWISKAVGEITGQCCGCLSKDEITTIIERHCPFKKDTAYRDVTAEDHPPVSELRLLLEENQS